MNQTSEYMKLIRQQIKQAENDDTKPAPPVCNTCNGQGCFKAKNAPVGHRLHGILLNCRDCEKGRENERRRIKRVMGNSEIPKRYRNYALDHSDKRTTDLIYFMDLPPSERDGKMLAYYAVKVMAANIGDFVGLDQIFKAAKMPNPDSYKVHKNSLVLTGEYGTLKTTLVIAALMPYILRGKSILWLTCSEMLSKISATYSKDSTQTENDVIRMLQTIPLLVVDDLNIQDITEWKQQKLEVIFRYRYNNFLPIWATANLDYNGLCRLWGERAMQAFFATAHHFITTGVNLREIQNFGFDDSYLP